MGVSRVRHARGCGSDVPCMRITCAMHVVVQGMCHACALTYVPSCLCIVACAMSVACMRNECTTRVQRRMRNECALGRPCICLGAVHAHLRGYIHRWHIHTRIARSNERCMCACMHAHLMSAAYAHALRKHTCAHRAGAWAPLRMRSSTRSHRLTNRPCARCCVHA
jgi:hypothetical protein